MAAGVSCRRALTWPADWDRTLAGRIVHRKLSTLYPEVVGRLIAAASRTAPGGPGTPAD